MKDLIYITGHKNPDSDSICSAIGYSELKKKLGFNATAARLGKINRETEFILNYFGVNEPELLTTVKTQVSDLNVDRVISLAPDISIRSAWMIMNKNNTKALPVVDEHERLIGLVTLSNITSKYMDTIENNIIASSKTPLRNIIETLNAKLVCGTEEDFKTTGKVIVAAMTPEQIEPLIDKGDIVIIGDRLDNQLKAIELGANCIIVTGGCEIDAEILTKASESKCIVMITPNDTFTTSRLINQSIPLSYVMTTNGIISFNPDDFVDEVRDIMMQSRYRTYPVIDENNKVLGFISRYHLISQNKKKLILMDHNEKSQSVHGIEDADLLEVIDHHRIADVQTGKPIYFRNEPVGSTSTIVGNMYFENGIRPSKEVAGVLLGAILSDTIKFKSPTCTHIDKMIAERLAKISGVNIEEFAMAMFKAGTSLHGITPEQIFNQDFKEFKLGGYLIGISQINTMDADDLGETKTEILKYMEQKCNEKNYNLLMILFTDIIKEGSEVFFIGPDTELISKAFNVTLGENSVYLPGVVSRKKQVVPPLSSVIE